MRIYCDWVGVPGGGGLGRGRTGALVFVLLVGLQAASSLAGAGGVGTTGRLG